MDVRRVPVASGASAGDVPEQGFSPVVTRTESVHRRRDPIAYDCVKLIFVRAGAAWLFSEFGERPVGVW